MMMLRWPPGSCVWLYALLWLIASVALAQTPERYKADQAIPVSCVDRNTENGEHKLDDQQRIVYVPFPKCNETGKPLELGFGVEKEFNCTIYIDDPLFHLLEFYVHNDVPMTCRIPSRPPPSKGWQSSPDSQVGVMGSEDTHYIPLIFALTGILQNSHIHVSNHLNILMHAVPKHVEIGVIDSATAYSISHLTKHTKIIPGASLPLKLSVRWYPSTTLPSGWRGVGGHLFFSTLVYCLLSAGGATAICIAYYRGVALPKRLRNHGWERAFATDRTTRGNGYGYGIGNGYGYAGPGKTE